MVPLEYYCNLCENYQIKFPSIRGRSEPNKRSDKLIPRSHQMLCGTRSNVSFPPGHFHTVPQRYCPATEHHYAVKLISQIWRCPFQMPVGLQLCCCDHHRHCGHFHILQTQSRRLDLSAAFLGSPRVSDRCRTEARPCVGALLLSAFFVLVDNLCSAQWDGAPRPCVTRLGCLFLHPSVRKSLLIKSPFSMLQESSESWVMYQHFHNFITAFGKSLQDSSNSKPPDSNFTVRSKHLICFV